MAKAHDPWTVLPHGPLETAAPAVWRVEGSLPNMPLRRVMTVARRSDGRVVIHSAIALAEAEMKQIEGWGEPAFLLVPNGYHRLDAGAFKRRYPSLRVFCPRGVRRRVEEVVPVDGTYDQFPGDEGVRLEHVGGTGEVEGVMFVHTPGDSTLVLNDILFNMPHLRGLQGLILRYVTGSSGGPRVSRLASAFLVKDREAVARDLMRWAETPELRRVIVSHHQVLRDDVPATLRRVAATLSARRAPSVREGA